MPNEADQLKLEEKVEAVLSDLRPMIALHGGDVKLCDIDNGIVKLEFLGTCVDCTLADITLNDGLKEAILLECPEVKDVVSINQ